MKRRREREQNVAADADVMNTGFHQGFESEATQQVSTVDATLGESEPSSSLVTSEKMDLNPNCTLPQVRS